MNWFPGSPGGLGLGSRGLLFAPGSRKCQSPIAFFSKPLFGGIITLNARYWVSVSEGELQWNMADSGSTQPMVNCGWRLTAQYDTFQLVYFISKLDKARDGHGPSLGARGFRKEPKKKSAIPRFAQARAPLVLVILRKLPVRFYTLVGTPF